MQVTINNLFSYFAVPGWTDWSRSLITYWNSTLLRLLLILILCSLSYNRVKYKPISVCKTNKNLHPGRHAKIYSRSHWGVCLLPTHHVIILVIGTDDSINITTVIQKSLQRMEERNNNNNNRSYLYVKSYKN